MQSLYSWMGTRLHLILEDDFADKYNRAQKAFFEAQMTHVERTHQQWLGHETLLIPWTDEEWKAFDDMARIINLLCEVNGGSLDIKQEDITSDYLVKL